MTQSPLRPDSSPSPEQPEIGRRTIARAAIWATPAAATALAAPAFASSAPTNPEDPEEIPEEGNAKIGLQGLINIGKASNCGYYGRTGYKLIVESEKQTQTVIYDDDGKPVDYGFYVTGAGPDDTPTNAKLTLYFPALLGRITWNVMTKSQWSTLALDYNAPAYKGYYAYSSTYSGEWDYDPDTKRWTASAPRPAWGSNPPNYSTRGAANCYCALGTMPAAARRSVTVAGKNLFFVRRLARPL